MATTQPQSADVIIVGAGSAGAILAARLSEDPRRSVLLIEAGSDYPNLATLPTKLKYGYSTAADMLRSDHDWGFVGRGTAESGAMAVWRGKVTGGSSAINGEIFLRGIPEDFDAWAARGNDRWTFADVLPYYVKLERDLDMAAPYHGTSGPVPVKRWPRAEWLPPQLAFEAACLAAGFPASPDHNAPDASGVGPLPLNTLDGIRHSTSLAYLSAARGRPNLTIIADCQATRILFDGQRATGIVAQQGGQTTTLLAGEIILSAGAVGSPHLLMLSGVGPAEQLRTARVPVLADRPGVGQNLRDHPHVYATWHPRPGYPMDPDRPRYQLALRYTVPGSSLRNDMQLLMTSYATDRVDRGGDGRTPVGITIQPVLNLARSSGHLTLRSADPTVQPEIDLNLLDDPSDRSRLRDALHLGLALARHPAFADILGDRLAPGDADLTSDAALDAWMRREVTHTNHICGTCAMGPASDPLAVVDQTGRVHGLERLRVVDLSIVPDCVRANTNGTAMMIGERIADLIAGGE
jgi:predicted dehydrogenase (TIGR03970 family)